MGQLENGRQRRNANGNKTNHLILRTKHQNPVQPSATVTGRNELPVNQGEGRKQGRVGNIPNQWGKRTTKRTPTTATKTKINRKQESASNLLGQCRRQFTFNAHPSINQTMPKPQVQYNTMFMPMVEINNQRTSTAPNSSPATVVGVWWWEGEGGRKVCGERRSSAVYPTQRANKRGQQV